MNKCYSITTAADKSEHQKLLLPDLFSRLVFDEDDNWVDMCTA